MKARDAMAGHRVTYIVRSTEDRPFLRAGTVIDNRDLGRASYVVVSHDDGTMTALPVDYAVRILA